jgi:glycosyltransferase involved in cell wall biosynthesis
MSASTLLAVPALDDTVRGRQIPRAMACGLPVLASDQKSLRHFVEHDAWGLLAPPGDLTAWTDMLRRASMSPEARKRWGTRARERALERLGWPTVARTFESILLRARGELATEAGRNLESGPAAAESGVRDR